MDRTGIIVDYDNNNMEMPGKIIEMGLCLIRLSGYYIRPHLEVPLYVEYGEERSKVALREEEARYIIVEELADGKKKKKSTRILLVGNPNVGKVYHFNQLCNRNQKRETIQV